MTTANDDLEDQLDALKERSAARAYDAAGRLNTVATIILIILSVAALLGAALGTGGLIRADDSSHRWYAVGLIVGSVLTWLSGALTCYGYQAVARYIEFRVDSAA